MATRPLTPTFVILCAACLLLASPSAEAGNLNDQRFAFELRSDSSDFFLRNSSFLFSDSGPQWFRHALSNPAAPRIARSTNLFAYDSAGDRYEPQWIGTNADAFLPP